MLCWNVQGTDDVFKTATTSDAACVSALNVMSRGAGPALASADHIQSAVKVFDLADIDAATAGTLARIVQPLLAVSQLLMISRIVLSWYPQVGLYIYVLQVMMLGHMGVLAGRCCLASSFTRGAYIMPLCIPDCNT